LEEIPAAGNTRFLVSTHHRRTMARMERLFGVTMAERGVSQLGSVNREEAEKVRESHETKRRYPGIAALYRVLSITYIRICWP